jgi:type I restriction enzyme S subunit
MFRNWWLEDLPKHWEIIKFKHIFEFQNNVSIATDPTVLSLTLKGVVVRDISNNEGQIAASYENYALVHPGDFVLNPMDLLSGSVAISNFEGVASNAYFIFKIRESRRSLVNSKFLEHYLYMCYRENIFFPFGKGLGRPEQGGGRWTLNRETLQDFPMVIPPIEEQNEIVGQLDTEISQIDEELSIIESMATALKTKRSRIVATRVLKGL